jgi:glutaredoxin
MNKKLIIPSFSFFLVLGFSFFVFSQEKSRNEVALGESKVTASVESLNEGKERVILFYGTGCPHCSIVDEYLEENNAKEKIDFDHKEIYFNRASAKELEEKAKTCGIPTDSIGVPFLWDGEKCFVGDKDIIEFFKQKISE